MHLALVALALVLPAAASAEAPVASRAAKSAASARLCQDPFKMRPARTPPAARLRRLGELPPGDLTLTVVNQVGDCIEPVVVRQGFGAVGSGKGR
jgi:hypothetical protein